MPPIAKHEIVEAILAAAATKAPGDDTIPNQLWHILVKNSPVLVDTLHKLFNACVRNGFDPPQLQRSITVVLRKRGGRDYQVPRSRWPVALFNGLGKHRESVIAGGSPTRLPQLQGGGGAVKHSPFRQACFSIGDHPYQRCSGIRSFSTMRGWIANWVRFVVVRRFPSHLGVPRCRSRGDAIPIQGRSPDAAVVRNGPPIMHATRF